MPIAQPAATTVTPKPEESGEESSHRPTKRARIADLEPIPADVKLNSGANGGFQEQIHTIEHEESQEVPTPVDTKDPSRAADLYLDTVRVAIVDVCVLGNSLPCR